MTAVGQRVGARVGHRVGQTLGRSEGAPAPWLLDNPPIEVVNFDASRVTLAGSKVSAVTGVILGSSWAQGTDAARPEHDAVGALGGPGAVFAGSQLLTTTDATVCAAMAGNDTPFSWIALFEVTTVDAAIRHVMSCQSAGVGTAGRYAMGHDASFKPSARKSSLVLAGPDNLAVGVHTMTMDTDDDTILFVDGVSAVSGATNDSARTVDSVNLGGQSGPANGLHGSIVEIAIYNRRIDSVDRARWSAYWGRWTFGGFVWGDTLTYNGTVPV